MGGGELSTDATNNLYWNTSQVNSQRGIVTVLMCNVFVTTPDCNITANSIILATPYHNIGYGNTFWITLYEDTGDPNNSTWSLNLGDSNVTNDMDFAYNILQY
jgi:hypothetical protein